MKYKVFRGKDNKIHYVRIKPIPGGPTRGQKGMGPNDKYQGCEKCGTSYITECDTCYANIVTEVTKEEIERLLLVGNKKDQELEEALKIVESLNNKLNRGEIVIASDEK